MPWDDPVVAVRCAARPCGGVLGIVVDVEENHLRLYCPAHGPSAGPGPAGPPVTPPGTPGGRSWVREAICAEPRCPESLWLEGDPESGTVRFYCGRHRPPPAVRSL